jgi:hypothetical protein
MVTMQPSDKGGPCMHVGSRANRRALLDEEKAKVFGCGVALER